MLQIEILAQKFGTQPFVTEAAAEVLGVSPRTFQSSIWRLKQNGFIKKSRVKLNGKVAYYVTKSTWEVYGRFKDAQKLVKYDKNVKYAEPAEEETLQPDELPSLDPVALIQEAMGNEAFEAWKQVALHQAAVRYVKELIRKQG